MSTEDAPATVTYTTKELLARIELKLDGLAFKIDGKASQHSVDLIDLRLKAVESEVGSLKSSRAQLMAIVALLAAAVPIAVAIVAVILHR